VNSLPFSQLNETNRDPNPNIRGLAIRTISSLRLPQFIDDLLPHVLTGLHDPVPYVRKTAVLACLKVFFTFMLWYGE
jgi:AP-4 complex subunit beta-1